MKLNVKRLLLRFNIDYYEGLVGVSSIFNEDNNTHVGFFDLDGMREEEAVEWIKKKQKSKGLGTMLLLQSSKGNYHGVCFDVLPFRKYVMMNLWNAGHCGYAVIKGYFVLRISSKEGKKLVEPVKVIKSESDNKKSESHIRLFNEQFNLKQELGEELSMDYSEIRENGVNFHFYNARVKRLI